MTPEHDVTHPKPAALVTLGPAVMVRLAEMPNLDGVLGRIALELELEEAWLPTGLWSMHGPHTLAQQAKHAMPSFVVSYHVLHSSHSQLLVAADLRNCILDTNHVDGFGLVLLGVFLRTIFRETSFVRRCKKIYKVRKSS